MAMVSTSAMQDAGAGVWLQLQQQQAQRAADQAQLKARNLQVQAREAESVAQQAQESARSLQLKSSQADNDARTAEQGLAQLASGAKVQSNLSNLHQQLTSILSETSTPAATPSAPPVLNAQGQLTGAVINVKA